jgi:exodeoxyribonuclease VII small subunit
MTTNAASEKNAEFSFEKAFSRLEAILETLNSQHPSLEDSLKLYEEADQLIVVCGKKLQAAERKIEMLMKNRSGELQLGVDQKPLIQDLPTS